MYRLVFHKSALKDLDKIPNHDLFVIKEKVWGLKKNPRPKDCKKLKGLRGLFRIRAGNYRIVYAVQDEEVKVLIVNVRHRRDVYKGL